MNIYNQQRDIKLSLPSLRKKMRAALAFHKVVCDEVALHFITDRKMRHLHEQFFNDPTPTDCISFPCDDKPEGGYFFLGDIFICPKQALVFVASNGGDVEKEITLYLVHGLLHLLGFDDMNISARKEMRQQEKSLMKHLQSL